MAETPIIDMTTTCPYCEHHEAEIVMPAEPAGFVEECCSCGRLFVDLTP